MYSDMPINVNKKEKRLLRKIVLIHKLAEVTNSERLLKKGNDMSNDICRKYQIDSFVIGDRCKCIYPVI